MLIITRRAGESFFIGDEIEVVILEGTAKVGIAAPSEFQILRTELIPPEELVTAGDAECNPQDPFTACRA